MSFKKTCIVRMVYQQSKTSNYFLQILMQLWRLKYFLMEYSIFKIKIHKEFQFMYKLYIKYVNVNFVESDALEDKLYSPESNATTTPPPLANSPPPEKGEEEPPAAAAGVPEKKTSAERDRKLGSTAVADAYRVKNVSGYNNCPVGYKF